MPIRKKSSPKPVCELSAENIYVGTVIGDNWVEISVMHADPQGFLHPLRSECRTVTAHLSHTPSMQSIVAALSDCWQSIASHPSIDYRHFVLCLPAWACHSRDASSRIYIEHDPHLPDRRGQTVTTVHTATLLQHVSTHGLASNQVVIDVVPHGYLLDNGLRKPDAIGDHTHSLQLDAHIVVADRAIVRCLLDFFASKGVMVDILTSPQVAVSHVPTSAEKESGSAIIDVDGRRTICSFFQDGTLHHSSYINVGNDHIHYEVAAHLDRPLEEVREFCLSAQALLLLQNKHGLLDLPLFNVSDNHPRVRQYRLAAVPVVQELAEQLRKGFNVARREMMLDLRKLYFLGDDPLALRLLVDMATDVCGMPCCLRRAWEANRELPTPNPTRERTAFLLRRSAMLRRGCQHYLEHYNASVLDIMAGGLKRKAREALGVAAHRFMNARQTTEKVRPTDSLTGSLQFGKSRQTPSTPRRRVTLAGGIRLL